MGKNGRKGPRPPWAALAEGILAALGIYLLSAAAAALAAVRGALPEAGILPALAVGSCLACWAGGWLCTLRGPWGRWPGAMAAAGAFAAALAVCALAWGEETDWLGADGALVLSGLLGGVLAGFTARRRKRRRRPAAAARGSRGGKGRL